MPRKCRQIFSLFFMGIPRSKYPFLRTRPSNCLCSIEAGGRNVKLLYDHAVLRANDSVPIAIAIAIAAAVGLIKESHLRRHGP